jgi:hypothetical protein
MKTVAVKVISDVLFALDKDEGNVTMLKLPDSAAAIDSVVHETLVRRL